MLHSFQGGCPRGVRLGSNMADKNQTFPFLVPENTRAGNALFSWFVLHNEKFNMIQAHFVFLCLGHG